MTTRTVTFTPTAMWATPLGADGKPCGPRQLVGPADWVSIEVTEAGGTRLHINPKEHTAMTTDRRTKPELREALIDTEKQLYEARDAEGAAKRRAADLEARQAGDDEALALDQCVRALERMLAARDQRNAQADRYSTPLRAEYGDTSRPAALDSPIGRILLHLAARYAVDIVAMPPAEPDQRTLADEGQALLVVPEGLANSISQLLEQQPWVADQLRGRR